MSQIIHMDTEVVSNFANSIKKCSNYIEENTNALAGILKSMPWEGGSREELVSQSGAVLNKISELKLELIKLSQQLEAEINQWIEVDQGSNLKLILENGLTGYTLISGLVDIKYLFGFYKKKDVDGVFEFFLDDQRGKDLLDDCKAANIRFEYEKDGEKYYFGADEGEIISIEWVEPSEIPNSNGVFSQESNSISSIMLNKELSNNYDIRETIAHEMQHAIDYKMGIVDSEIVIKPYQTMENLGLTSNPEIQIDQINWNEIEKEFEASLTERVHTEILAHTRGYEFNPELQTGESILNMDNTYTSSEYKVILNQRGYASVYEKQLEETFKEQGLDAAINVYWDNSSESVKVDINNVTKI
jgi:uncharacterized protein YukE